MSDDGIRVLVEPDPLDHRLVTHAQHATPYPAPEHPVLLPPVPGPSTAQEPRKEAGFSRGWARRHPRKGEESHRSPVFVGFGADVLLKHLYDLFPGPPPPTRSVRRLRSHSRSISASTPWRGLSSATTRASSSPCEDHGASSTMSNWRLSDGCTGGTRRGFTPLSPALSGGVRSRQRRSPPSGRPGWPPVAEPLSNPGQFTAHRLSNATPTRR